ncbi:hypothetical protein BU14_2446s0001, partial [Porphyra umbilicalis]
ATAAAAAAAAAAVAAAPTLRQDGGGGVDVKAALLDGAAEGRTTLPGDASGGSAESADGNGHRVVLLRDGAAAERVAFWVRPTDGRTVRGVDVHVDDPTVLTAVDVGTVTPSTAAGADGWAEVVVEFTFAGLPGTTAYEVLVEVEDDAASTVLSVTRYYTAAGVAVYTLGGDDGDEVQVVSGSAADGLLVGDWLTFLSRQLVTVRARVVGLPDGVPGPASDTADVGVELVESAGDVFLEVLTHNKSACAIVGGADTESDDALTPPTAYGSRSHAGPATGGVDGGPDDGADLTPDANGGNPTGILADGCGVGFSDDGTRLTLRFNLFRVGTGAFSVVFRWPGLAEGLAGSPGAAEDGGGGTYTNTLKVEMAQGPPPPIVLAGYDTVLDAYGGETVALPVFNVASPPVQPFRFKRLAMLVQPQCPAPVTGAADDGADDEADALDAGGDGGIAAGGGGGGEPSSGAVSFPWVQAASALTAQPWQTLAFRSPSLLSLADDAAVIHCVRVLSSLVSIDLLRDTEQDPGLFRFMVAPPGLALPRSPAA